LLRAGARAHPVVEGTASDSRSNVCPLETPAEPIYADTNSQEDNEAGEGLWYGFLQLDNGWRRGSHPVARSSGVYYLARRRSYESGQANRGGEFEFCRDRQASRGGRNAGCPTIPEQRLPLIRVGSTCGDARIGAGAFPGGTDGQHHIPWRRWWVPRPVWRS